MRGDVMHRTVDGGRQAQRLYRIVEATGTSTVLAVAGRAGNALGRRGRVRAGVTTDGGRNDSGGAGYVCRNVECSLVDDGGIGEGGQEPGEQGWQQQRKRPDAPHPADATLPCFPPD